MYVILIMVELQSCLKVREYSDVFCRFVCIVHSLTCNSQRLILLIVLYCYSIDLVVFGTFDVEWQSISLNSEIAVVYHWFVISIRFDRISSVVESNHVQLLCLLFTVNAN